MNVEPIITVVIAIIAAAPGAIALFRQINRDKFDLPQSAINAGITASSAAANVIRQYSDEIKEVRAEMRELRLEVDELQHKLDQRDNLIEDWRVGISRLSGQVASLGHSPVWQPKPNTSEVK